MTSISSNSFLGDFNSLAFNLTKHIESCIWKFKEAVSPTQIEELEEALFQFNANVLEKSQETEKALAAVNVKLKALGWLDKELVGLINQINVTFMSDQELARHIDDKIWKSKTSESSKIRQLERAFFRYNSLILKNKSSSKIAAALKLVHAKLQMLG